VGFTFLLFSIPAGFIGAKFGRKRTILTGLALMSISILSAFIMPRDIQVQTYTTLPLLGNFMNLTILLMLAGIGWSLININSLPVVVDLTDQIHIGTYTGLYYLFSTLAAIAGPNINGLIIKLAGNNYASIFVIGPVFMLAAFFMVLGMKTKEPGDKSQTTTLKSESDAQQLE